MITSPRSALTVIAALLASAPHPTTADEIKRAVREGLAIPAVPMGPSDLAPPPAYMDRGEALDLLWREATVAHRHYLPCEWLRALATAGRYVGPPMMPVPPGPISAQEVVDLIRATAKGREQVSADWLFELTGAVRPDAPQCISAPWPIAANADVACGQLERFAMSIAYMSDGPNLLALAKNIRSIFDMTHADIHQLRERRKPLTPVEQAADQLLAACFEYADVLDQNIEYASTGEQRGIMGDKRDQLSALLDPLRPPAPTLDELAAALHDLMVDYCVDNRRTAEALLQRVPK